MNSIPHYTRPIDNISTSDIQSYWWCHPRRKCRGGVGGNAYTSAYPQAGKWEDGVGNAFDLRRSANPNVCNHNYTYNNHGRADVTWSSCWNKLKGVVPKLVHAQSGGNMNRNIGVRYCDHENQMKEHSIRGVRSCRDANEWRYKQSKIYCRLNTTSEDSGHHDQGGVVKSEAQWWPRAQNTTDGVVHDSCSVVTSPPT